MKKRVLTLVMALIMIIGTFPMGMTASAESADPYAYAARNFMAMDNGAYWGWYLQVSWINPTSDALSNVSLYKVAADGTENLIADKDNMNVKNYGDTNPITVTPGAKTVYRPNGIDRGVANHVFKLVSDFADGTQTVQYTTGTINYLTDYFNTWGVTKVAGDWTFYRHRGGNQYYRNPDEIIPAKLDVEYKDADDAYIRLYSNTELNNYYAQLKQGFTVESGANYTVSYDYALEDCESVDVVTSLGEARNDYWLTTKDVKSTDGWQHAEYTLTAGGENTNGVINFELKLANAAVKVDNVSVVKEGTEENLIQDAGFSGVAALMNAEYNDAAGTISGGKATVTFGAPTGDTPDRVKIYERSANGDILLAEVPASYSSVVLNRAGDSASYVIKAVNSVGVESKGVEFTAEKEQEPEPEPEPANPYTKAARNFMALDDGMNWEYLFQVSWVNPTSDTLSNVSFYQIEKDGTETLIADKTKQYTDKADLDGKTATDITPGAKNLYRPYGTDRTTPIHMYKLVCDFTDGTQSVQYTTGKVRYLEDPNVWAYSDAIGNWSLTRLRAGIKNLEMMPARAGIEYRGDDPYMVLNSSAHTAEGNYYAQFSQAFTVESGANYTVSFDYALENCESVNAITTFGGTREDHWLTNTKGWKHEEYTVTAGGSASGSITFELKRANTAVKIDNVSVVKQGTTTNLVQDSDFSGVAALATAEFPDAVAAKSADGIEVKFGAATAGTVSRTKVYERTEDGDVLLAELPYPTYASHKITNIPADENHIYIVKSVNNEGIESYGTVCETVDADLIKDASALYAATDLRALNTGNDGKILITWKNADYSKISKVSLYSEDGTLITDALSTEPAAVQRYVVSKLADSYTYYNFRLVTETTDGGKNTQYVSGEFHATDGAYIYPYKDNGAVFYAVRDKKDNLAPIYTEIDNTNAASGKQSLKVVNHLAPGWAGENLFLHTAMDVLAANTSYDLTFRVKGSLYAWQKVYQWDYDVANRMDLALSNTTYDDWTTMTYTFTTPSTEQKRGISFAFENNANGTMWIDDIVLKKADGTVVFSESFENCGTNDAAVAGLAARATDSGAVVSWTAPGTVDGVAKEVRVYAERDGIRQLAGTFAPDSTGCTIDGLKNNKEYTIIAETVTEDGLVSEQSTVRVTPVPAQYKVTDIILTDAAGTPVAAAELASGDYKVTAKVKNNSMGNDFTAELIVCLYDGNTLISAKSSGAVTVAQSGELVRPASLTTETISVPDTANHNYKLKAYVWNSLGGMKPLGAKAEFFK